MNNSSLANAIMIIVLCLLVYLAFKPDSSKLDYLKLLKDENKKIVKQIDSLKLDLQAKIDSIKVIEKKETIIRNYYYDIYKSLPVFSSYRIADSVIRVQLDTLGSARFDGK